MSDILRQHALKNIWAESIQDNQHRVKPTRISPRLGYFKTAGVMWEGIRLPNYYNPVDHSSFHVYPIGQLPPSKFQLNMENRKWYQLDQLCEVDNVTIDVYMDNGAMVPRSDCYLIQNYDQNLVLIIRRETVNLGYEWKENNYGEYVKIPYSLDKHDITVRFYQNAVMQSDEWRERVPEPLKAIRHVSRVVNSAADLAAFIAAVKEVRDIYGGIGAGLYFANGYMIEEPRGYRASYKGVRFTYQYDETIRQILSFPLRTTPVFKSTLDSRVDKYLLLGDVDYNQIDFFDDCDFYLVADQVDGTYQGVYIDGFEDTSIRQVVHNGWSVRADRVNALAKRHDFLGDFISNRIIVVIREGGMNHGLGFQQNRIEDLYHLPRSEIIEAMTQVESTMPYWKASALEASAYIHVMSNKQNEITQQQIEEAYGYNAAIKAVSKPMYLIENNQVTLDPAFGISTNAMKPDGELTKSKRVFFWYDVEGALLGYTTDDTTRRVISVPQEYHDNARYLEVFLGNLQIGVGENGTTRDKEIIYDNDYGFFGYRNYVCSINNGRLSTTYIDVTAGPLANYIVPEDGSRPYVKWNYALLSYANLYPVTRFANTISIRTFSFTKNSSNGGFMMNLMVLDENQLYSIGLPPGHIDVFMNKQPLHHGIDYYYTNAGQLCVTKQADTDTVDFVIRFYGYPHPTTGNVFTPTDVGFVKNGVLSHNQIFNVTHDRCTRIVVGGGLKDASEVSFAEEDVEKRHLDGYPYTVGGYQALVEPFTGQTTVDYLMKSVEIDQLVSEYLSPRLPEPVPKNEYVQGNRWKVYSPIMTYFIDAMRLGYLPDTTLINWDTESSLLQNTQQVVAILKDLDPVYRGFDDNYVDLLAYPFPTTILLTRTQYMTLERINRLHLKSLVDISHYVTIIAGS